MIIKIQKDFPKYDDLIKAYTIKNQDFERQARIRKGNNLDWLRTIKLYRKDTSWNIYLPVWKFWTELPDDRKIDIKFNFTWTSTDEQEYVLQKINSNKTRTGLIDMKTARGKSYMIMRMINDIKTTTLIMCHNIKTLKEMYDKIKEQCGYECWLYYGKKKEIKEITITTHTSFVKDIENKKLNWFWCILYDECHKNISTNMITRLIQSDTNWLFWFTWTVRRQEICREDMQLIFWDIIKLEWQDNNWYNILPEIFILKYYNTNIFSFETWNELRTQMINDEKRFQKQLEFILLDAEFKHWLLLFDRVEECEKYYNALKEHIECWLIHWKTKIDEDEKIIKSFEFSGKKNMIIWTVQKIWTWVDIQYLDTAFLFFPCRFYWTIIQAAGRILRNYPWKYPRIYDFNDLPLLKNQAKERLNSYYEEYKQFELNYIDL